MYDLVTVIITTYDSGDGVRYEKLYKTLDSLRTNLKYPAVEYLVTDDSTPEVHKTLVDKYTEDGVVLFNTNRSGVGFAKNNALKFAFASSPYVLLMEDDWKLKDEFDLHPHMEVLRDNEDVGMIRFGFLGGRMTADLSDYGFPKTYWKLQHKSGHYVYSGQVSLRHQRFYDRMGYHAEKQVVNGFEENIEAGREEDEFCHRYNNSANPPAILWSCLYGSMLNCGPFENIGMSVSTNAVKP